jgi:Putative transposase/Transposase zinc-binding domain
MNPTTGDGGQSLSVHQLLRQLAPEYCKRFGSSMPLRHRRVLNKILRCRTPALGGQLFQCPECPGFDYRYHSCNDRHCPQCGQTDAEDWLQRQRARLLLPVPYFLVTFTVPEELRFFIRSHQRIALDLLFGSSAQALQDLAANPRRLGAQLGMLGVLHTWSRTLIFHPHIHYLVPGGGLSPDGRRWIAAGKFLLHHKALGVHCRTLFKTRLQKEHPELFAMVPAQVWKRPWNVGCQAAGSGENALRYLSRYVFKTATSNRIVRLLPEGKLRWDYRESKTGRHTSIPLDPLEFMSRFLQHILPPHFARVRTFGWLHPAAKVRANRVRALLRQAPLLTPAEKDAWQPPADPQNQTPPLPQLTTLNLQPVLCPRCQKVMQLVGSWLPGRPQLYPKRPP